MKFGLFADTKALCRVCMTATDGHRTDLYDGTSLVAGQPSLHEMLKAICAAVFDKSDADYPPGFPTQVCANCRNAILVAFKLHQTCIETDRRLGELLALKWELQDLGGGGESGDPLRSSNEIGEITDKSFELGGDGTAQIVIHPGPNDQNNVSCPMSEEKIKVEELDLMDESGIDGHDSSSIDQEEIANEVGNEMECGQTLQNTARLRKHLRTRCAKLKALSLTNKEVAIRTCRVCGKFHQSVRRLFEHMKQDHPGRNKLGLVVVRKRNQCSKCQESFPTKSALTKHRQVHNAPFKCSICGKELLTKQALKGHIMRHSDIKPHNCDLCPLRFYTTQELKSHMLLHAKQQNAIREIKLHKCKTCNAAFPTKEALTKHRPTHNVPSNCSVCGKTLNSSAALKVHMMRHADTKAHCCELCPLRFYTKGDLYNHKASHIQQRTHICDICGSKFAKQSALKRHVKLVHEGLRPFECQICGFKLFTSTQLKRHLLGHSKEKPYKCELCTQAFVKTDELANHVARKHRGGLPYPCDRCDESFRLMTELRHHYRVHVQAGEQIDEMRFTAMATLQRIFARDKQKLPEEGNCAK
ncbi:zinc finger protein [Culex quinquefasciatus]|uniref:Zinc finger protein n=1 Tax=Culex quinquefasciatus TaxID=7176 RepID=B0WUT6_CULQU|nr:zinc finger protein [Culex quinquefasciatus]|eukprot:XP_001859444.1 zinc finger protein [Culex quinquefasciatus]